MSERALRVGTIEVRWHPAAFLSPAAALWAAERFWSIVAGDSAWPPDAPVGVRILLSDRAAVSDFFAASSVDILRHWDGDSSLPDLILPTGLGGGNGTFRGDGALWDLITFTFLMLSRWEEREATAVIRDTRGRFRAQDSVAFRQGFLDRPVVDEWALAVRGALERRHPWRARPKGYRVHLTHDIDSVRKFAELRQVVRSVAASAIREPAASRRHASAAVRGWRRVHEDPHVKGVRTLMDLAEARGRRAAFYFKTSRRGSYDTGYDLARAPARELFDEVCRRGHEVGFHPGYRTVDETGVFQEELRRFRDVAGDAPCGGRQHNLRFVVPDTWVAWESAGLAYDSSLGFAERAGFRCGTCHPFPAFDFVRDRPLCLVERPLILMDTTLRNRRYEGADQAVAVDRIRQLSDACRRVGGEFVMLWHNSSFDGAYAGWRHVYESGIDAALVGSRSRSGPHGACFT